ncbi:hypothetical protein PsW64_03853 [Pseudovibrio sp. W64]|nr:hypothetical protein PsW64_03853 [Pseudovibrio sp. W64]
MLSLSRLFEPKKTDLSEGLVSNAFAPECGDAVSAGKGCSMKDREFCHDARCYALSQACHAGCDQHQFIDALWAEDRH